jgi:aldose 1-epimerase
MAEWLRIRAGDSVCDIAPHLGGSITRWTIDDQPMLRTSSRDAVDPLQMASFPLVPFSNRIGGARFMWQGSEVVLPAHPIALPHVNHGLGWLSTWTVSAHANDQITLRLDHAGDERWPWPFVPSAYSHQYGG